MAHKGSSDCEHHEVRSVSMSDAIGCSKFENQFYLESDQSYQVSIDNVNLTCIFVENKCMVTDVQPKTV